MTMRPQLLLVGLAGFWSAGLSAQTPSEIRDLIGARAAGGETQLEARGYTNTGTDTGDDRKWTYWWNPKTQTCVTVATVNGRYDSITTSPAPDCRRGSQATPPPRGS